MKKFFEFGLILRRIVQRREIFAEGYLVKLSNLQDRHQCRELVFCFVAIDGQMYAIYKIFLGGADYVRSANHYCVVQVF